MTTSIARWGWCWTALGFALLGVGVSIGYEIIRHRQAEAAVETAADRLRFSGGR